MRRNNVPSSSVGVVRGRSSSVRLRPATASPLLRSNGSVAIPSTSHGEVEVQEMLNNIVRIAANCSRRLQSPAASTQPPGTDAPGSLKRDEIERIVRRVEQHYSRRLEDLERENELLRRQLTEQRHRLPPDTETLRHQLNEEKRHRLACEEQCQRMTEEHAKVVSTIEQRMRKQERQILDMSKTTTGCTPRSARFSTGTPLRESDDTKAIARFEPQNGVHGVKADSPIATVSIPPGGMQSVVFDFLSSIGRELDEINAAEVARSAQLRTLL